MGKWILIVYHSEYFPYGKGNDFYCVYVTVNELNRILGLFQENYRIFNPQYVVKDGQYCLTSATWKIYFTPSDCDNDVNAIATYNMVATYDNNGKMLTYKSIKQ